MRWIKLTLKAAGALACLIVLLFLGTAIYVNANKTSIFKSIKEQLQENISGTLTIGHMEPSLIRGFPAVSILLQNVTLRDSLWNVHHHTLLEAKEIYISINALSVLSGSVRIRDINIRKARIFVFTDSTGYSNTNIFYHDPEKEASKKKDVPKINNLYFSEVAFVLENKPKSKLFEFDIKKLAAALKYTNDGWKANLYLNTLVKNMMFNTAKGSFLKDKRFVADLDVAYNREHETVLIPEQKITIGDERLQIAGEFVFTQAPATFILNIKAPGIRYKNAIALLTPSISSKIKALGFNNPIDMQAIIKGHTAYHDTPYVVVNWQVKNNTFNTPGGDIEKCNFTGTFINERIKGAGHSDLNALVVLRGMTGDWFKIPFRADTLSITNLINPVLEGRFMSTFDITKLNPLTGDNTFHFDKGTADVNVLYKGGINSDDTTNPYLLGYVQLADAAMTYVPRSITFTNCGATLRFTGSDLFIDKVKVQRGPTVLNMEGSVLNFLNLYYTAPDKILLDWHVQSANMTLDEFIPLLASRKTQKETAKPASAHTNRIFGQLDQMLDAASVRMRVNIAAVNYHHFTGEQLNGDIIMSSTDISLNDLKIKHADGTLKLNIHIKQQEQVNNYTLTSAIEHVNVKKFFTAFDNFGQDAITDKNIHGDLSANVNVNGAIRDNGKLVPRTLDGAVSFKFENGSLVHFDPFRTIGSLIFRNRNLDSISFKTIDNKLYVKGDKIMINRLFIESSALNMHAEGVYAVGKPGTDINIDVPLRNPKKDELIFNDELRRERNMKGIIVHLKATDGADGKVKIKWNMKNDRTINGSSAPQAIPEKDTLKK